MIREKTAEVKTKSLLTFILFLLASVAFASVADVNEQEIEEFRNECLNENAVEDSSCIQRYQSLTNYVENNTHLEEPTADNVCIAKNGEIVPVEVNELADEVDDLTTKLTCNKEDEEFVQDHCGKQMACNMGRSVVTIVDSVAPSFISNKVQRSLASVLSAEEGSSCMDKDQPNCLSEVYRAFISSLVATFNSLRDIGKAIKGAFSNMRAYLFEKGEDLHAAANTAEEETTSFFESPGKYIMEKLTSFKTGIDTWIKEQVFCQKWEGEPHSANSKCVEPLQGYGCLDCNDGINAFCAGAGFFMSEGLLTIATAGTFTGLGVAARAGGALARAASIKGATALTARVPALAKLTNRSSRATRRSNSQARRILAGTVNRYNKAKESVAKFGELLASTKVVRAAGRVAEVATKPMQVIDKLSNRAMERVLGRAASIRGTNAVTRAIRETARQDFRAVRMANRGEDIVTNGAGRASKSISGARVVRVTNRNRTTSNTRGNRDRKGGDQVASTAGSDSSGRSQNGDSNRDQGRNTGGESDSRFESSEDRRKREERERVAQEQRNNEGNQDERNQQRQEEDRNSSLASRSGRNIVKATRIAVVADLAAKGVRAGDEAASEVLSDQAVQSILEGEMDQASGDMDDAIRERTGADFQSQEDARRFAENMNNIYSDPKNRGQIVDRFMKDKNLSRSEANKVYESEKSFYQSFAKKSGKGPAPTRYAQERQEISGLLDKISAIKADIKIQEAADGQAANQPLAAGTPSVNQANNRIERSNPLPRVASTPTPRASSSGYSSGASNRAPASIAESTQTSGDYSEQTGDEAIVAQNGAESNDSTNPKDQSNEQLSEEELRAAAQVEQESKEKAVASRERMEVMEFLSLLLLEAETGKLSFRAPTSSEKQLVTKASAELKRNLTLDQTRVVTLGNPTAPYYLFKDFQSGRTVVVDSQGNALEDVPNDII